MERYYVLLGRMMQHCKDIKLPKLIYKVNSILIKVSNFLIELDKLILKLTWKSKSVRTARIIMKENKEGWFALPNIKMNYNIMVVNA